MLPLFDLQTDAQFSDWMTANEAWANLPKEIRKAQEAPRGEDFSTVYICDKVTGKHQGIRDIEVTFTVGSEDSEKDKDSHAVKFISMFLTRANWHALRAYIDSRFEEIYESD